MSTSSTIILWMVAMMYVISGVCQPLLMTICTRAGLANSSAQLYMLFYYLGPTILLLFQPIKFWCGCSGDSPLPVVPQQQPQPQQQPHQYVVGRPSTMVIIKASAIAMFDIIAQSFNYTGASYAGASIFALIYSSVTIWTAIFSRCILFRTISYQQCMAILLVFAGLCVTSFDSKKLGSEVVRGTIYIIIGSCMHGATYVLSEAIMMTSHHHEQYCNSSSGSGDSVTLLTTSSSLDSNHIYYNQQQQQQKSPPQRELLSYVENSAIQGMVACSGLFVWQMIYTIPHWEELIHQPTQKAGTTIIRAILIFSAFSITNLFHSVSFYYTVAHFPGGSTSAGVMKGLQAVLVFVAAHFFYCNNNSTDDKNDTSMCFTTTKCISLITVMGGVALFRYGGSHSTSTSSTTTATKNKVGYAQL